MRAIDYENNLDHFLKIYNYQPNLTKKIDNLNDVSFTQSLINEIVLWKVDRYVSLNNEIMRSLDNLKSLTPGKHRQVQPVLETLLNVHGVDLPMASTFFRFRNPKVFQIIDKHAYRAVYDKKYPLYTSSSTSQKVSTYFGYLDKLIELCQVRNLEFQSADRLLYIFDKQINGKM